MATKLPGETDDKTAARERNESGINQRSFRVFATHPRLTILFCCIALLVAGYSALRLFLAQNEEANIVHVNGRIESPETYIAAPTATHVKALAVKEGDPVHKGQLIVTLDSENLQNRISQSKPALNEALQARKETDRQVAAVQHQIGEARAQSHGFFAKIFSTKSGREKQAMQLRSEMLQAKMMSMQAHAAVASVQGAREQATSKLSYFNITCPTDGICTVRSVQPGELVAAGQVMLTVVSLESAYMRGFVPESDIARIKIGQAAQVSLDSQSGNVLNGRVTSIDASPSFTPENVYFKKDRLRQAFGINISIDHPNGLAKPGMPAEAKIVLNAKNEKRN